VKLQFGLLWFENDYSKQEEDEIRNGARQAGFELEITNSKDGSDLAQLAERQQKFHEFDLILLDLNLDGGVKGDELAPQIRKLFRSTPILFYSGSGTEAKLRDRMAKNRIEGVFCVHRKTYTTRASELVQDYAHTLNRLSGMRGLAMEVVAKVDVICRNIIAKIAVGNHESAASEMLNKAVSVQSQKNLDEYSKLPSLDERMGHPATDSMKSFNVFRELLKIHINELPDGEIKDRLSGLRMDTKDYRTKVIEVRNVLGHALETQNEAGWQILDRHGKLYMTVQDFPRHRSDFLANLRAVHDISKLLIPKE
jgi:CheY-like chemotaxis protein